jgi:hypothetical protein
MTEPFVDFTFYVETFLGEAIAADAFARLALRATEKVDALTFGRASTTVEEDTDADTIALIQNATCAVAEEINRQELAGGDAVASETVGAWSVTFAPNSFASLTSDQKIAAVMLPYLAESGLMFAGFTEDEQ